MIRFAEKADEEQISKIFRQSQLKRCDMHKELKTAVSVENAVIQGCLEFFIQEIKESTVNKYCKKCFIVNIAVDENHQRQGIGSSLIDFVQNYAVKNDCGSIELNVSYENYDGVDFCSSVGFEPTMYKMEIKLN